MSGCWMSCYFHQTTDWIRLTSDADTVTGAAMLETLNMGYEELAKRDYVWRFNG